MRTFLRVALAACCVGLVFPPSFALAQMSFQGLDSGGKKAAKKKKPKANDSEREESKRTERAVEAPAADGGTHLATPAEAPKAAADEKPKKADKAAAAMTFEAVDVSGKSSERQKVDAALAQFKGEKYDAAALAAYQLMQDPKHAGLYLESQYLLAKALYRMGLYHSSLGEFSKLLGKGAAHNKFFKTGLEWLFFISHKTTNEAVILDEIARYSNAEFPERFRTEFYYLLARYHFVRGKALDEIEQRGEAEKSFGEVRRLVVMVARGDAFYPRAKYLEGLVHFRDNKQEAALESFKEVIRMTRRPPGPLTAEVKANQALRELAFMQLARTHYGARQNRYAIYYYGKVERGNTQWLEALFESSWASYRIGQYEQALGNLITLSSPFFRDEYFPEALILKAVIYYENCRYRESTIVLEDFERIYGPVQEQLKTLVDKQMDSNAYYQVLSDIQKQNKEFPGKGGPDAVLERVLKLALTDEDLKKTNASILELEAEIDSLSTQSDAFKFSELAKSLIDGLKGQRELLIRKAGIIAKGKIEFELGQLKRFMSNGLRIRFETTTKEKEFLEEQLRAGGKTDIIKQYKYSVAVSDNELYWPYEGEYWRDELGTYHYTLTKGCIEREAIGAAGERM